MNAPTWLAAIWSAEMAILISFRFSGAGTVAVSQVDSSSACGAPLKGAMGTPEIPFMTTH